MSEDKRDTESAEGEGKDIGVYMRWAHKHPTAAVVWEWGISVLMLIVMLMLLLTMGSDSAYGQKPQIYVDNVNGASLASGSPEGISAVTALATCHTNGVASTTIQWPANGLSGAGVPTDGTAILFIDTASGRKFSRILGLAAGTVLVANSFNITLAGARDCGAGGRLLNVSTQLALDMLGGNDIGWQVYIVNAGANYTWTANRNASASTSGCGFFGVPDLSNVKPTVDCDFTGGTCLTAGNCDIQDIEFRNTNANKTGTIGIQTGDTTSIKRVIVGGTSAATAWAIGINMSSGSSAVGRSVAGSLIRNNIVGISKTGGTDYVVELLSNVFRANTTAINVTTASDSSTLMMGNIFWENGRGLALAQNTYEYYNAILLNTFHGNTTAAIDITDQGGLFNLLLASNLFTSNSIGVRYTGAARNIERESTMVDYNCYGTGAVANGSNISGFILGPNVITLNPLYVDVVTGDFTPTVTNFTIQAWPPGLGLNYPGTQTESFIGCGAIQPAGGGAFSDVGI